MCSQQVQSRKALTKRTRQSSRLYLPLDSASANRESLRIRIALESARTGKADRATVFCLVHTTLLTELLCAPDSGDSLSAEIAKAKAGLAALLEQTSSDRVHEFSTDLLAHLTATVNVHERQLLDIRLGAIIDATERLESRLRRCTCLTELLVGTQRLCDRADA